MLHGLPLYQTEDMPTWAFDMSASVSPVAYSIACEAPCDFGWVIFRDTAFRPSNSSFGVAEHLREDWESERLEIR